MANGLLSNEEMIDTLIVDCDNAVNAVITGNGIQWCKLMYEIVVKLSNLKRGIHADLQNRDENISILKQMLKDAGVDMQEVDLNELEGSNDA